MKFFEIEFNKVSGKTISIFTISILVLTLISFMVTNIVYMVKYSDEFSVFEWIWCPVACALVYLTYKLGNILSNLPKCWLFIVGGVVSNIFYLYFLLSFETYPCSDWAEVWKAAQQMANGTFRDGVVNGTYMHEIPYQIGLAYIESLFIRLFGTSYIVLKLFNLFLMNLIGLYVYHFALRKGSQSVACYSYLAASCFLCWSMTAPQFTNHSLGFIFLYLSLYLWEKKRLVYCAGSGVALALLNFIRPMGALVIVAYLCSSIYDIILTRRISKTTLHFFICIACYVCCTGSLDSLMLNLGYTDTRISQTSRNMYHKITYGTYESKVDGTIRNYDYDYDAYDKAYREEIISTIKDHPKELTIAIANKMCRYLGCFDYGFEMTYNHDKNIWTKYPIKAIYSVQWFQYIMYIVLALFGYLIYRKKNIIDVYQIFFIGNTLVYIFVEAFTTYRFENYFYVLFLVGYGMKSWQRCSFYHLIS